MVRLQCRQLREGQEAVHYLPVVLGGTGREPQFEEDRRADCNQSLGGERRERRAHGRLRQAREHAGVGKIAGPGQLFSTTPSIFCRQKVEPALLAQQCYQFQTSLGLDNLAKRSIDGLPEGLGAKNHRRFVGDIPINLNRCLTHSNMISRSGGRCSDPGIDLVHDLV
jgi:hypothetical protein